MPSDLYRFANTNDAQPTLRPNGQPAVKLNPEHRPELLGGVTVIREDALTAIPYYAWLNRGGGEMTVWFARESNRTNTIPR